MCKFLNLAAVIMFLSACAVTPPEIRQGAATGAAMTSTLDSDLQAVIKVNREQYDERTKIVLLAQKAHLESVQSLVLEAEAFAFGKKNTSTGEKGMKALIGPFMTTSMARWSKNYNDFDERIKGIEKKVNDRRTIILNDRKNIKKLRANFLVLSTKETGKETLKYLIKFSKQVKTEYDALDEKAK